MKRLLVATLAIVMLLVSCSSPTIEPTIAPTNTATLEPTNTQAPTSTVPPTATNTPEPTDTPEPTATSTPEPTNTAEPTPTRLSAGLGLTRNEVTTMFKLFQFTFTEESPDLYVGTISDELAIVTLTGPEENLLEISVEVFVPKKPTAEQGQRAMLYLVTLATAGGKDWVETSWLTSSLDKIDEETIQTFDTYDAIINVTSEETQTTAIFTIRSK